MIDATGRGITRSAIVSDLPSVLALILAVPVQIPRTIPKLTVATAVSELDHVNVRPDSVSPTESSATTANDTPVVVIVAKKGLDPNNSNVGIWLRGAIDAGQGQNYCPIVLISDGKVIIEHATGTVDHSYTPYLSVYADTIVVMGPNGSHTMEHDHYLTAGEDSDPQGMIDHIAALGLLPMAATRGSGFTFVSTSWREIASTSGN